MLTALILSSAWLIYLFVYLCVSLCVEVEGGQFVRVSSLSLSPWEPGTELRPLGLAASAPLGTVLGVQHGICWDLVCFHAQF